MFKKADIMAVSAGKLKCLRINIWVGGIRRSILSTDRNSEADITIRIPICQIRDMLTFEQNKIITLEILVLRFSRLEFKNVWFSGNSWITTKSSAPPISTIKSN